MTKIGTLALLALMCGCSSAGADQRVVLEELQRSMAAVPRLSRVEVVSLEASKAGLTLELPGELEGWRDALLGVTLGGFVEEVRVSAGDEVTKGQVLVRVDRSTHVVRVAQLKARLEGAQGDLLRVEKLGDLATEAQLAGLRTAAAIADADLQDARIRLSRSEVRAPFDGVVGGVSVEVGEIAAPGSPVVRLVQLDPLRGMLSVSDRDVVALETGLDATVSTAALADRTLGKVVHISPVADLSTRSFVVEVEVPNPDRRLLPGMVIGVEVSREVASDAVVLPQEWLVTRLEDYGVYVLEGDVARWHEVELGEVVRGEVVVEKGLKLGDRVVVTGQQGLTDGEQVLVVREGTCCVAGRPTF